MNELLANDIDPEGSDVSFVSVGTATNGTVAIDADNTITFTPTPDYYGSEAGFNYTVQDAEGLEVSAFVQVDVINSNDAPVILNNQITTNEDQAISFDTATVERFLHDADGDSLSLSAITNVTGGVISESGGIYTFSPDADYHGDADTEDGADLRFMGIAASANGDGWVEGSLLWPPFNVNLFGAFVMLTGYLESFSRIVDRKRKTSWWLPSITIKKQQYLTRSF